MNNLNIYVKLPLWADPLFDEACGPFFVQKDREWCGQINKDWQRQQVLLVTSFLALMGVPYEIKAKSKEAPPSLYSVEAFFKAFLLDSTRMSFLKRDLGDFNKKEEFTEISKNGLLDAAPDGWGNEKSIRALGKVLTAEFALSGRVKSSHFLDSLIGLAKKDPGVLHLKDTWGTSFPQWAIATIANVDTEKWIILLDKCVEAKVDIFNVNKNQNTLAHGIVFNSRTQEMCDKLLGWAVEHGVEWNRLNASGHDALHLFEYNPYARSQVNPFNLNVFHGDYNVGGWVSNINLWISNWEKKILENRVNTIQANKIIEAL